jgi:hypothetical protein
MLAALATVLVLYVIQQERRSGSSLLLGSSNKPRATLGSSKNNPGSKTRTSCDDVAIDSPDFARCATALGSGRTVLPGNPSKIANNINTGFISAEYSTPLGNTFAAKNPFATKVDDSFIRSDYRTVGASSIEASRKPISKAGAQAFPFSQKGTGNEGQMFDKPGGKGVGFHPSSDASPGAKFNGKPYAQRKYVEARSKTASSSLGASKENGMSFSSAFLGAAVSPSSHDALGATPEEIAQSANKLEDVNRVGKFSGGQLNLLVR